MTEDEARLLLLYLEPRFPGTALTAENVNAYLDELADLDLRGVEPWRVGKRLARTCDRFPSIRQIVAAVKSFRDPTPAEAADGRRL